ncbi:hypothetical protein [Rhizobium leguminosarum]|uniref:hypothetical protein n=1 Tax=Rhizobium leguminosarum TaxID=384 RepID=UPI001FEDDEB2|nr:hypothetical protein [Rhizobium leguminosarum]
MPFTPQASDALFDGLRQIFGKENAKKLPVIKDEELQTAASMFTLSWLFDKLERAAGLPSMQNTDGDDLIFHDVRFPLAAGVSQKDIAARVRNIPGMSQENAKVWNWLEQKPKHDARKRSAPSFDTTMDNGARVLGNVELKGKFLHLSTNSVERAQMGTTLIQQALGDLVRTPLTEIRTIEQMMAERPAREKEDPGSEIPPEIAEQVVHQVHGPAIS